jgi:hypothetical protein
VHCGEDHSLPHQELGPTAVGLRLRESATDQPPPVPYMRRCYA